VARTYHVALATVGLFTTALFLVHSLLQVPVGRAVDARGARRIGLVALAILAGANAIALLAPEPALVVPARALVGVGTALGFLSGIDYVRAQGGSAFAQGLYGGVALGAGGLALALVPQLLPPLGWRAPFLSAIAIALAAGAVLAASPRDAARGENGRARTAGGATAEILSLVTDRRLHRLCVLYGASFGLSVVLGNWVVTLLERAADYSTGVAGAIGALVLLSGVVSRPLAGYLARLEPARVRQVLAAGLAASAAGTLLLAAAGPPAVSVVGALLVGLAAGVPFAVAFGAAARTRPDAPAAAIALVNMSGNVVILTCTPLLGLAFSLPGEGRIGFAAAAVLTAATILAVRRLPELGSPESARAGEEA